MENEEIIRKSDLRIKIMQALIDNPMNLPQIRMRFNISWDILFYTWKKLVENKSITNYTYGQDFSDKWRLTKNAESWIRSYSPPKVDHIEIKPPPTGLP